MNCKKYKVIIFSILISFVVVLLGGCEHNSESPTVKQYTVTFDTQGGSYIFPKKVNSGDVVARPQDPVKKGYTFDGWYFPTESQEEEYYFSVGVTSDITLKAHWLVNSYKIVFDKNDAKNNTGTMKELECEYDKEYNLTANTFTNTGYSFRGWTLDPASKKVDYQDGAAVKALSALDGDSITLYALWSENPYHIINYKNLPDGRPPPKFKESNNVYLITPQKDGYVFEGWYDNDKFDGEKISGWSAGTHIQDITLYAKWALCNYTVRLLPGNALPQEQERTITATYTQYLPSVEIQSYTGATFEGYYTQPYAKGIQYIDAAGISKQQYDFTEDIELYGAWSYEIIYTGLTQGSNQNKTEYTGEKDIEILDPVWKPGYKFLGWTKDGKKVAVIPQGTTGRIELMTDGWDIIEYSIEYELNGTDLEPVSWTVGYDVPDYYTVESSKLYLPREYDISRTGYNFAGWYTEPDFSGDALTLIEKGSYGDLKLYAKWE